jgi:signal transduction histidine kinase
MKFGIQSFYAKISAIFLLLLLILVVLQLYLSVHSASRYVQETEQKLNRDLAQNIAIEFRPFLKDTIQHSQIEELIHYLMVLNPRVEFYLLDEDGTILSYFAVPRNKVEVNAVDLDPVLEFLDSDSDRLVLGDDPRNQGSVKPISVSRIRLNNHRPGYLYVILGSEQYDSAAQMVQESYILKGSAIMLALAFIAAAIIGLILFGLLTRRFNRLYHVVHEFQKGHHDVRVNDSSRDEIGRLGQAFDQMADTLAANMEQLKRTDDLRRELVANVSHDLRTPLASIRGYIETIMMKLDSLDKEEQKRYLQIISKNTQLLNSLVSELFELSKLDAKQIEPHIEHFSMAELTQDVILKFQPLAKEVKVQLVADLPTDLPPVNGDIGLIERALSNLIDNAIRNTPAGGRVKISLESRKDQVYITISDTGKGILAKDLPYIFDRFKRIEKQKSLDYAGAGLGLAIAKKVLEIHKSTIHVKSQLDQGTEFSFALSAKV